MATKKQKREEAEAKRTQFEAELKADGLAAQKRDREDRARRQEAMRQVAREENARYEKILYDALDAENLQTVEN